jgi:hypothetical protein
MPATAPRRTFLVECYAPDIAQSEVEAVGLRAASAAAQLRSEGRGIEYVRALLVPGDDAVFHVFSADAIETVREAGERAAMSFARVVESVTVEAEERMNPMNRNQEREINR